MRLHPETHTYKQASHTQTHTQTQLPRECTHSCIKGEPCPGRARAGGYRAHFRDSSGVRCREGAAGPEDQGLLFSSTK